MEDRHRNREVTGDHKVVTEVHKVATADRHRSREVTVDLHSRDMVDLPSNMVALHSRAAMVSHRSGSGRLRGNILAKASTVPHNLPGIRTTESC
jgi:hypothetical protein